MKRKSFSFSFLILLILMNFIKINAQNSLGTEFWVTFQTNFSNVNPIPELSLFITSGVNTAGTVSIPGQGYSFDFNVTAGNITTVTVPTELALVTAIDGTESRAVKVVSNDPVTVYGLNFRTASTDAYLAYPVNSLGNEYLIMSYRNIIAANTNNNTMFAVVASENNTIVTITPSVTTGIRSAGVPYQVTLNQGDVYQLRNTESATADFTGTLISSDKPIGVFGGHSCANVPFNVGSCDILISMLPSINTWGKNFVTIPFKERLAGDHFRFLAGANNTTVFVNGVNVAELNRGEFHEMVLLEPSVITSTEPILVAQFANGQNFDRPTIVSSIGDPSLMIIPPYEQFLNSYTVSTPGVGFQINFANVVVPNSAIGSITLDGIAIPASEFSPIAGSDFSGAQVTLLPGSHNFSGTLPFGVFMYGFSPAVSYGYQGGQSFSPIATVTSVELAPKTTTRNVGQQHCVTATVLDQFGDPVEGVRVDFEVSGANSAAGFSNTDSDGKAQFCYTGTSAGSDNIVASVGTLSDDASVTWSEQVTVVCPFSQGYWKNHPKDWPGSALPMKLGTTNNYNKDQLLSIFNTPPRGDASIILAYQLIAAKLNVANGSPVPSEVADAILDADNAIANRIIPAGIRTSSTLGQMMTSIAKTLDMYNNKLLTPECLYEPEMTENKLNREVEEGLVLGNYPNPFNPITQIRFAIPENSFVTLKVYNTVGQLVRTLVSENLDKGFHNYEWNATDDNGNKLSSGIYLYRLQAGELVQTHKMILMK